MSKLYNSIMDLINDTTSEPIPCNNKPISFSQFGMDYNTHRVNSRLLVGDPSKHMSTIIVREWSPNKDYVQVQDIEKGGETVWVHRQQLYVLDIIKAVDALGNIIDTDTNEFDIKKAVAHWEEKYGKYNPSDFKMHMGKSMGKLTGSPVLGIPKLNIENTTEIENDVIKEFNSKINGNRRDTIGGMEIEGNFPAVSSEAVRITFSTDNIVTSITTLDNRIIKTNDKYMVKLKEDGISLINMSSSASFNHGPVPPVPIAKGSKENPNNIMDTLKPKKNFEEADRLSKDDSTVDIVKNDSNDSNGLIEPEAGDKDE